MQQYRVLARKYRPTKLSELVGQDALERALGNAISAGRVHHAYLFTGIRGIGKTTTARIMARSLNCVTGPTIDPCGVCEHCTAIAGDNHMDVIEIDAASRTGVGDIREIIENSRYLPSSARYKIYIIDEVHMLSTNAFNALLKTLEEPPAHVKFVLATTEIRKIPVTIVSRCQRFDLRRISVEMMGEHLKNVCAKEDIEFDEKSISLIARTSEGSARDALSLLDQAISLSNGKLNESDVSAMLGLGDKSLGYELLNYIITSDSHHSLETINQLAEAGAEPAATLADLMQITVNVARCAAIGTAASNLFAEQEYKQIQQIMSLTGTAKLSELWQAMSKGYGDIKYSNLPVQSLQMLIIRLCHLASMPNLESILDKIGTAKPAAAPTMTAAPAMPKPAPVAISAHIAAEPIGALAAPASFEEIVALFDKNRMPIMASALRYDVALESFSDGFIALSATKDGANDIVTQLSQNLKKWTGKNWQVTLASKQSGTTIAAQNQQKKAELEKSAVMDPLVQTTLESFDGAAVKEIKLASA